MTTNQGRLEDLHWQIGTEGREFNARYVFSELKYPNAWGNQFSVLEIINGSERRTAALQDAVEKLTAMVAQLSLAQGVTIDYDAIAKKVNDDAAKRMGK